MGGVFAGAAGTTNNDKGSIKQIMEKHSSLSKSNNIYLPEECESLIMKQYDNIMNSKSSLNQNVITSEGRQFEDIQNKMYSQYL